MIIKFNEYSLLLETLQKGESILKNKLTEYEKLKSFLSSHNSMGYMGKFTEFLFSGVPYNELVTLYNQIIDFKNKNIKINIDSYDKYESALDDIDKKKIAYKFKVIYNQFPKEQKALFDLDKTGDETILTISKLYDVDDIAPFIRKISRYKSQWELISAVERFLEGKLQSFDKESVKSMLDDDLELVFENDNILIVKTKTWEALKKVGSDTSWCIARSLSTFNSYTKDKKRNQYVVFDYTKDPFEVDFKIGFTVSSDNRITNAHDILDHGAISQVSELLENNNVKISDINIVPKVDFSKFNKTSTLEDIESAINSSILEDEDFSKILSILCWKLSRARSGYEIKLVIKKLFKKLLYKKEVEILSEQDIEPYRDCFTTENQFNSIKDDLSNSFILLTSTPPGNIFNSNVINKVLKYYKYWNYTLSNGIDYYMQEIEGDKEYADVVLFYALKMKKTIPIKILIEYCKFIKGEKIDLENVKRLINSIKEVEFTRSKESYYNFFGIKYHFDEKKYYNCEVENIIPEKVILKEPQYSLISKLQKLTNCEVVLNYTKDTFLKEINDDYKILNNDIVRKVNKVDEVLGQMINVIKDKLTFKSRKIEFKDDVQFPVTFEVTLSSSHRYSKLDPKKVIVIIK